MEVSKSLSGIFSRKKTNLAVVILCSAALLLVLISSLFPDKKSDSIKQDRKSEFSEDINEYCSDTENRLEKFLESIDGAGEVRVYLTIGTDERYVYAKEMKQSRSDKKNDEEEKYVIIGGGGEKNALIETIQAPQITGAVVACTGCSSPQVKERIYKSVSAALGLPTAKIYVTKLK